MEVKDLQREVIDAERLAERGRIILQQTEQLQALAGENQALKKENEALKQENEELKAQLAAKESSDGD